MEKIQPPQDLKQGILLGIAHEELRRAKVYFTVTAMVVPVSLVSVFFSSKYLIQSLHGSGFYEYFSLLVSGDSTVFTYWRELVYSLVETVPVVGIIAFLVTVSFLVWSGANTFTHLRRFALSTN